MSSEWNEKINKNEKQKKCGLFLFPFDDEKLLINKSKQTANENVIDLFVNYYLNVYKNS